MAELEVIRNIIGVTATGEYWWHCFSRNDDVKPNTFGARLSDVGLRL
ncbi:LOW QUALITY PROTEIN: hypothetical protein TorRG33x02_173110 [Trema orientale]|uniref:Uncharacterized protein n=1 Tax=Trema orientale TaxID=63057 RepID=A0A2P5EMZ5_TREOI|nr:LOW QUALITY PROTEIN: hypothetical protein TorRG33x02_173110 [Trema orientale]